MKILLQSRESYGKIASFDTDTFLMEERTKIDGETIVKCGFYDLLGDKNVFLFSKDEAPYIAVDKNLIEITANTGIEIVDKGDYHLIRICINDHIVMEWLYKKPVIDIPPTFLNFCAEGTEDFDFGVFLEILSKDRERLYRAVKQQVEVVKIYNQDVTSKRLSHWIRKDIFRNFKSK